MDLFRMAVGWHRSRGLVLRWLQLHLPALAMEDGAQVPSSSGTARLPLHLAWG